jgi:hypothetical protein
MSTGIEASRSKEEQIALFREQFEPVAQPAVLLYFCAADFSLVNPMCQFSLKWFVQVFKQAVQDAPIQQTYSSSLNQSNIQLLNNFTFLFRILFSLNTRFFSQYC